MNYEALFEFVVVTLHFFDSTDERSVQLDTAVKMLEVLSSILKRLDPATLSSFLAYVETQAQQEFSTNGPTSRFQFLTHLPENMGLG